MFWNTVHQLDQQLTLTINSWNSAISDPIWVFFSKIPVWIPMYVAVVGLLIWRLGWKKGLIITLAAAATFGFCDQFSNLIKDLVGRIRPAHDEFMLANGLHILENGGRSFSFFSAHAANAFGFATSTVIGLKNDTSLFPSDSNWSGWGKSYIIWIYFWAAMVAISRIFVGRHYLGDVIAGSIIGVIAGVIFTSIANSIIRKYQIK